MPPSPPTDVSCSQRAPVALRGHRGAFEKRKADWHEGDIRERLQPHTSCPNVTVFRKAIIALHVLLYWTDSLPLPKVLFSVLCHVVYLQNFSRTWPLISLTSPSFVASCALVIVDHFIWFFHFAQLTNDSRLRASRAYRGPKPAPAGVPSFGDMATFFGVCVWLAPLFLFLSLSANDNALPTASGKSRSACEVHDAPLTAPRRNRRLELADHIRPADAADAHAAPAIPHRRAPARLPPAPPAASAPPRLGGPHRATHPNAARVVAYPVARVPDADAQQPPALAVIRPPGRRGARAADARFPAEPAAGAQGDAFVEPGGPAVAEPAEVERGWSLLA